MIDSYLKNLIKVLAVGAAFAGIPLFAALARLEPPWPPAMGYVSSALVLLAALVAWEWTRGAKVRHRRRWILAGTLVTVGGLFGYLALYSFFVEAVPGASARVIRGYECLPDAVEAFPGQCPDLPRESIEDAGWETTRLWTRKSITTVRLGLALSWLLFTAGLILTLGSVVAGRDVGGRSPRGRNRSVE
jgi:hypothetical protein